MSASTRDECPICHGPCLERGSEAGPLSDGPAHSDRQSGYDVAEVDWEARVAADPWSVVMDALAHQAQNEPVPDDLMEATEAAAVLLACVAFVRGGLTADEAFRLFDERDYTIHLRYKAEQVEIDIQWEDGEVTTVDSDSAPIDSIVDEAERALRPRFASPTGNRRGDRGAVTERTVAALFLAAVAALITVYVALATRALLATP